MVSMANKIRVGDSINKINKVQKRYAGEIPNFLQNAQEGKMLRDNANEFSTAIQPYNSQSLCLNNNSVSCRIKDETKKREVEQEIFYDHGNEYEMITVDDMNNVKKLEDNVNSMLCKDYISAANDSEQMFDAIINKVK